MGGKISNDISSESMHRFTPQNACIPLVSACTKVVERIVKFWIFDIVFCLFSLSLDHLGIKVSNGIFSESTH